MKDRRKKILAIILLTVVFLLGGAGLYVAFLLQKAEVPTAPTSVPRAAEWLGGGNCNTSFTVAAATGTPTATATPTATVTATGTAAPTVTIAATPTETPTATPTAPTLPEAGILNLPGAAAFGGGLLLTILGILFAL